LGETGGGGDRAADLARVTAAAMEAMEEDGESVMKRGGGTVLRALSKHCCVDACCDVALPLADRRGASGEVGTPTAPRRDRMALLSPVRGPRRGAAAEAIVAATAAAATEYFAASESDGVGESRESRGVCGDDPPHGPIIAITGSVLSPEPE